MLILIVMYEWYWKCSSFSEVRILELFEYLLNVAEFISLIETLLNVKVLSLILSIR